MHDLKLTKEEQASGMDELIRALMLFRRSMGCMLREQLVIRPGAQQALYILLQLIPEGKKVLLEQPTYAG